MPLNYVLTGKDFNIVALSVQFSIVRETNICNKKIKKNVKAVPNSVNKYFRRLAPFPLSLKSFTYLR